ncbi:hypothetical protein F66182_7225 [Fusarium sp. NRRL 66182]|nr:hypothetical protein F66182_7225 [Fusarium sp. NRRL 66182]
MIVTTKEPTAPKPEIDTVTHKPPWLIKVEDEIIAQNEDVCIESIIVEWETIRDVLLSSDSDQVATQDAAERLLKHYETQYSQGEGQSITDASEIEKTSGLDLNSLSLNLFQLAGQVPYISQEHDRLASLLVSLKENASKEVSQEHPQFVFCQWGLEAAAKESWNGFDEFETDNEYRSAQESSEAWISVSALIAKLFKAGLLDKETPNWISREFEDTFETATQDENASTVGRRGQILATVNYILISGEAFVHEFRTPSHKWRHELSPKKWKLWTEKLQETANSIGNDEVWHVKDKVVAAHARMIELYPEAFD